MKINWYVFIIDLSVASYHILLFAMYLLCLTGILCNLSVHVFIKLIYSKLIYFEGRACYIGKINQYMLQMACSFVLYLIVKAVSVAGAACSSLHI